MNRLEELFGVEMDQRQQKLYQTLIFFSKLLFAGLIFQAILNIYPDTTDAQTFLAQTIAFLINPLMKASFTASGIDVVTEGVRYVITQDCLGWKSMAAFTALVFASAESYRKNVKYLVAGVAFIYVANIARIITTIYLSELGIVSFDLIHDFFWKWSLTALVLVMWVFWFEKLRHIDEPFLEFKAFLKARF
jgi:exosortase/archaeosortase family protein